jgi:multidrug resistance efflux pump
MKKRMLLLAVVLFVVAGCGGGVGAGPTPEETIGVVQVESDRIIAEGVIEPVQWVELRFEQGGTVADLPVAEGSAVEAGDLLVELDGARAALAVEEAEAALALTEAQLAQVREGPREEEIAAAEARYRSALAQYRKLKNGPAEEEIEMAQAGLGQAEAALKQAQAAYDAVAWRPEISMLPQSLALEQATLEYQRAQAQYELATQGATPEDLQSAWQSVEQAEAHLALARAGATEAQIAAAEAAVRQAEVALEGARLAQEQTLLRSPFSGTLVELLVEPGELASPGQLVAVVATLDSLHVRTTDLTELDVVEVEVGQPVLVRPDALHDVALTGRVQRIGARSVDYRGDVTYPLFVDLEETTPELRWGMTVVVEIEVR